MLSRSSSAFIAVAFLSSSYVADVAASAATLVAPNAQATTLGNGQDNDTNFFGRTGDTDGNRFQQVYDAGQFTSIGTGGSINGIALRAKTNGGLFPNVFGPTVTVSNIMIRLSTTQTNSSIDGTNFISPEFAANIGTPLQTVYSGSLTVTTPTAGTTDFGYVINFQTPYAYVPSSGNLLLDVLIPAGATTTESGFSGYSRPDTQTGDALGANANDGIASAFGSSAAATIGGDSTTGFVTQFNVTPTPEPGTLSILALASAFIGRRRARRSN